MREFLLTREQGSGPEEEEGEEAPHAQRHGLTFSRRPGGSGGGGSRILRVRKGRGGALKGGGVSPSRGPGGKHLLQHLEQREPAAVLSVFCNPPSGRAGSAGAKGASRPPRRPENPAPIAALQPGTPGQRVL